MWIVGQSCADVAIKIRWQVGVSVEEQKYPPRACFAPRFIWRARPHSPVKICTLIPCSSSLGMLFCTRDRVGSVLPPSTRMISHIPGSEHLSTTTSNVVTMRGASFKVGITTERSRSVLFERICEETPRFMAIFMDTEKCHGCLQDLPECLYPVVVVDKRRSDSALLR